MKVLIADEHALFRDGLGLLIEQLDGSATILQASNFAQALKILDTEHKFDLIIIDLDMQDMVWEKGFDAIRAKAGDARLVVISASENVHNIRESLEKGASGYITKRAETKILSNALKLILDGGTYIPPVMLGKNLDDTPAKGKGKMLTNRQSQVLGLVAKGMSNLLIKISFLFRPEEECGVSGHLCVFFYSIDFAYCFSFLDCCEKRYVKLQRKSTPKIKGKSIKVSITK